MRRDFAILQDLYHVHLLLELPGEERPGGNRESRAPLIAVTVVRLWASESSGIFGGPDPQVGVIGNAQRAATRPLGKVAFRVGLEPPRDSPERSRYLARSPITFRLRRVAQSPSKQWCPISPRPFSGR